MCGTSRGTSLVRPASESSATTSPHTWTPDEALERLSSRPNGQSDAEARRRLQQHGPNALPAARPRSAWLILIDQLRSVVVLLLCAAAAIALMTRDPIDAVAIGAVLLINTTLGFVTELRARRAIESLVRLQTPRAVAFAMATRVTSTPAISSRAT